MAECNHVARTMVLIGAGEMDWARCCRCGTLWEMKDGVVVREERCESHERLIVRQENDRRRGQRARRKKAAKGG